MKTIAQIGGLFRGRISDDLFDALCVIYPEGCVGNAKHCFFVKLDGQDDRTKRILDTLETAGLTIWPMNREFKKGEEYSLQLQPIYDDDDFEACSYLEVRPPSEAHVKGSWRRPVDPFLMLDEPSEWNIITVKRPYCYAMIDRARQILEAEGINNMVFRPVKKRYESVDYDLYDEEDIWRELRSDLILPPLAPSMTLLQKDHEPFQGDFSKGCMREEGLYMRPELHYLDSDLTGIEPFDLAHTYEMFFGLPDEYDRPLVVSKRFYDVCKKHDIKTGWVPVRIDDA